MESRTMASFTAKHLEGLKEAQIVFADKVYAAAEKHYSIGGDTIVECYTPKEIIDEFESVSDAMEMCRVRRSVENDVRGYGDLDPLPEGDSGEF